MAGDLAEASETAAEPIGWRVLDPDGNVVGSGPCIELEMVTEMGEPAETEQ